MILKNCILTLNTLIKVINMNTRSNGYPRRNGMLKIPVNQVVNVIIGEHYPSRFRNNEEQFSGFIGIRKSEDNYKYLPEHFLLTRSLEGIANIRGLKKDVPLKIKRCTKGSDKEAIEYEVTFRLTMDLFQE